MKSCHYASTCTPDETGIGYTCTCAGKLYGDGFTCSQYDVGSKFNYEDALDCSEYDGDYLAKGPVKFESKAEFLQFVIDFKGGIQFFIQKNIFPLNRFSFSNEPYKVFIVSTTHQTLVLFGQGFFCAK